MMDFTPLVTFGVLLVRVGMLVATTPLFGGTWAPMQVKVGLTAILAIVVTPFVALPSLATPAVANFIRRAELGAYKTPKDETWTSINL